MSIFSTCFHLNSVNIQSILAAVLLYNGMGLTMLWVYRKIVQSDLWYRTKHWKMGLGVFVILIMMFLLNYIMLILARYIMDIPDACILCATGWKALSFVWLVQVVTVCMLLNNTFYRNMTALYQRNAQLEKAEMNSRYMALQNQLNPHFLFNSLNTLVAEIEYDPKTAVAFTRHLSDVYRYILQCSQKKTVTLKEELDFLKSYLFLHSVRLGPCIHLCVHIPDFLQDRYLPPLTLQLLVENIIKHNAISSTRPMDIEVSVEGRGKMLKVANPIRLKQGVVSAGKGLENLRQRYFLLSKMQIEISNVNNNFIVKVPLL